MSEDRPISDVRVAEVFADVGRTSKPATVRVDEPLRNAVESIVEDSDTRKVYVLDADDRLMGTITLETLLRHAGYRLGARRTGLTSFLRMMGEISRDKVQDVMTKPVKVLQDEMIVNVTRLMVENHLNDLPVVDDDNRLVGELNGIDILKASKKYWQ